MCCTAMGAVSGLHKTFQSILMREHKPRSGAMLLSVITSVALLCSASILMWCYKCEKPSSVVQRGLVEGLGTIGRSKRINDNQMYHRMYLAAIMVGQPVVRTYRAWGNHVNLTTGPVASTLASWARTAAATAICRIDDSVLHQLSLQPARHYSIVANLYNSENIAVHFAQQLAIAATFLPGTVSVSIYESGSIDMTNQTLKELDQVLRAAGVTSCIVHNGNVTRGSSEPRITFLARVRNAALYPVVSGYSHRHLSSQDKIIILNDVCFCANDVLRLAVHKADMACGLDLYRRRDAGLRFYGRSGPAVQPCGLCHHIGTCILLSACLGTPPSTVNTSCLRSYNTISSYLERASNMTLFTCCPVLQTCHKLCNTMCSYHL